MHTRRMKNNQHFVGCWIDKELKEKLDTYCSDNETFISEVIRMGIEEILS